jgi:copper resistance protein D
VETDWLMIATRLGLYLSLILLSGLAAFPFYALRRPERVDDAVLPLRLTFVFLAVSGLVLSGTGFLVLLASMSGNAVGNPDWQTGRAILFETPIGTAWMVRMAAMIVALLIAIYAKTSQLRLIGVMLAGAAALASLVWTGHAGASEGNLGLVQRVSDILHMLAAAVWLGGIAAFLLLLRAVPEPVWANRLAIAHRSLEEFSRTGAICVSIVAVTGLVNAQILVGFDNIPALFGSDYGLLLMLKLLAVGIMLLLAANNRWRLTPSLGTALEDDDPRSAVRALRTSLLLEASAAFAILALVAWLGTLEPTASLAMP